VPCVCRSLAAYQRHTLSSLAAVIGLSNNDVISLRCVPCVEWKPRFRRNRSCSASDSACYYAFLRSAVCLSVVCHIRALCLNRQTDLDAILQVHRTVTCGSNDTLCWMRPQPMGRFGDRTPSQNMHLQLAAKHMLPPGEYKRGVGWTCHRVSAFCQITLVFVML